jgi:hypothetical protein
MLRVIIDTNVLVSALLKPDSVPEFILSLIRVFHLHSFAPSGVAILYGESFLSSGSYCKE